MFRVHFYTGNVQQSIYRTVQLHCLIPGLPTQIHKLFSSDLLNNSVSSSDHTASNEDY
jgi:hypothetical protein